MAIRYAVANGNWSSTATWDGGTTLPSSTDDVYANNFTVNINQSITVNSLKKIAGSGITAGGSFVVTAAATVTITAGIAGADNLTNTSYLLLVDAGSAAVAVNGNIVGGASTGRVGMQVAAGYSGVLTITGNLSGGASATVGSPALNVLATSAQIVINGSLTGGTNADTPAVANSGTSTQITVNGNLLGGATASSTAAGIANTGASAQITVNGNVTAGASGSLAYGLTNSGTSAQIAVTGVVTGGGGTGTYGVHNTGSSAQVTIAGEVIGGAGTGAYGVFMTAGFLRLDAKLRWGSAGCAPVHCQGVVPQFKRTGSNLAMQAPSDDNWPAATGVSIVVQRYNTGLPAPDDVRSGVTYDPTNSSTGTLAVPPPTSVAAGVPTDDTVGTAAVLLADVLAGTGAQIAAATSG